MNTISQKVINLVYGASSKWNEIELIPCSSWKEFQHKVKFTKRPFGNRVFRGQRESQWNLESKWDRYRKQKEKAGVSKQAIECRNDSPESFIEAFKQTYVGNASFDTSTLDDYQWMALARHHGLITPLLDWTKSPYVAAYFAFRELLPMDLELGCLNPTPLDYDEGDIAIWEIPLNSVLRNLDGVTILHSRGSFSYRQKAQSALFTRINAILNTSLDDFLKANNYRHILYKYLIPKKEAIIAMHDVHLMSINEGTMFPDADGAARQANLGDYFDWISLNEQSLD